MPAVQHSPPLRGYDQDLRPVPAEDSPSPPEQFSTPGEARVLRTRTVSLDADPRSRPVSRGRPLSRGSRPTRFTGPASSYTRSPRRADPVLDLSAAIRLGFSPPEFPTSPPRRRSGSSHATASTQFDLSVGRLDDGSLAHVTFEDEDSETDLATPIQTSDEDSDSRLSSEASSVIQAIYAMDTEVGSPVNKLAATKRSLNTVILTWKDEFEGLDPGTVPLDELKELVANAKLLKDRSMQAILDCDSVSEDAVSRETRMEATAARSGMIKFIKDAFQELKLREDRALEIQVLQPQTQQPGLNISATSSASSTRAKSIRVEKYSPETIGDMQVLIDQIQELTLEPPTNQLEFRGLQDKARTTQKEVDLVKKNAKELIDLALECDLVDESEKLEDVYRNLERKERGLMNNVQDLKDRYGIVGDNKNNDIKYPTFSGEQTDKLDFYTFKEDWDTCVAVKAPSTAEQVRLLTRQVLTGLARTACCRLDSVEEIFERLRQSYGNISALFSNRVDDIRRLGACTGSNEKKMKWAVELRSQVYHLRDLSVRHGMYEDLYNHRIVADIQEALPGDVLRKFLKKIRKLPGERVAKKVIFEALLDYLEDVVDLFNHNYSYKMDHGVDPDQYYRAKNEAKKNTPPSATNKSSPKKNYTATSVSPDPSASVVDPSAYTVDPAAVSAPSSATASAKSSRSRKKNLTYISAAYNNPAMTSCRVCSGNHTHVYYCEKFCEAAVHFERLKIVQKCQSCFRCLRMDSNIDFKDKAGWEERHDVQCQTEYTCKVDECAKRPKNRQYHFTLCKWHVDENKKRQGEFIKKLDPAQSKPGTSFFFNTPSSYYLDPDPVQMLPAHPDHQVLRDVNDPSIFMLQTYTVDDRSLLLFYDSGCMGSALSDRGAVLLDSVCVREGPTLMSVAGGKTVELDGGDEQFLLDLVTPKTKATITGLRMHKVTTKFPLWRVSEAWADIQNEYKSLTADPAPLPPAPQKIGGCEVDIMIGIRYQKYFPDLLCTLPCGLGIYRSKIAAPRGELTILGGPHPAWRHATDSVGFMGSVFFFSTEFRALRDASRDLHHVLHPVEHEPEVLHQHVPDGVPLLADDDRQENCNARHCIKHQDMDEWIIPPTWDIDNSVYGVRQEVSRFSEGEEIGTEVTYRCVRCRNCNRCRQGESLETASLKEEQEQFLIDQSVSFNSQGKYLIAKLPFISDPGDSLRPNRYTAEKILDSQVRNLAKDEQARIEVLAAFEKLRSGEYVIPLSDLPPEERDMVVSGSDSGYIIPWRAVWKHTSISTPCRMVFDASSRTPGGESLNNILAKGVNKLAKIHNVLLRFRSKPGAFTCDVRMAYNQIRLDPSHYRYQQFLWKPDLDPAQPVVVMVVRTLIYGVKSAGNQLFSGFGRVADYCIEHYPEHRLGALALKEDGYVDDIAHSSPSYESATSTASSLDFVLTSANLSVKAYTFAGTPPAPEVSKDGTSVGLVGLVWEPESDFLGIDIKDLYFGKSKRGVLPELVSGDVGDALRRNFTRRNMLGKTAGVYDPLGLLTPVTSRFKLDLHDLCMDKLDWDDKIPDSYLEKWLQNLDDIQALKEIRFRRAVVPPDAASLNISLLVSSDASKSIAVASVHARVLLTSGLYSCQLISAKSKIVCSDTIPRGELRAAVMSTSLAHSVKFNLRDQYSDSIYVTDSTIVLHWLHHDERPLETAVRNAVIEIRRLSDLRQWFHVDGVLNIADLGTRHAEVSEIGFGSEWQDGKEWMRLPFSEMPLRTVEEINLSSEERRLASQETKGQVLFSDLPDMVPKVSERIKFSSYVINPTKRPWDSSIRIVAYILRFVLSCKKGWSPSWFPPTSPFPPEISSFPILRQDRPHLHEIDLKRAENYFFIKATKEVIKFSPEKEYKDSYIIKNGIYHYVGRILDSQEIASPEDTMFDLSPLSFVKPIVERYSPIAYSIMLHAHETISHHRSGTASLLESRTIAFILRGRDLAAEVARSCRFCIRHRSKLIEVEMGKLHQSRLTIAPVFHCVQVDLFGPLTAICEHQHRSTVKVYGVVFKDPACCAVSIHVMQDYSTAAFLQAYTRFAARYGHPSELRIDEGSQLMKACSDMNISMMDLTDLLRINHQVGIKHSTCAVASHNAHGMVERSIREIKRLLNKVYKGIRLDILSHETCFAWIASELNNLPICIGSRTDKLDHVDLITPSRLLLGRNNRRALSGYATISSPSRLIQQMDLVYEVWWKVWRSEKLADFIPQPSKWNRTNEQLQVGDIVVFLKTDKENRLGDPVWRIARVVSVDTSVDGLSRNAELAYRNPSEKTFRTTTRSVRTVVVVHREEELDLYQYLEQAAEKAAQQDLQNPP